MWRICRGSGVLPSRGGGFQLIIVKVGKVKRFYAQELSHIMDEEVTNDAFPYLKELENKIGREMPESLLMWFRDAADYDDVRKSSAERELSSGLNDSFSVKISTLKQEMVSILTSSIPTGFHILHHLFCGKHLPSCIF